MTTRVSEVIRGWLGWCPNAPVMRTAPAALVIPQDTVYPAQPDAGGAGSSGRIRRGIGIATGSIKTLIRNKRLLWFSFLTGLVMLFMIATEVWTISHIADSMPFLISLSLGDAFLVFDTRLFLLQLVCLICFIIILAGLVIHLSGSSTGRTHSIREGFAEVSPHTASLAALSFVMALAGSLLFAIITQTQLFGKIVFGISMVVFYLPYAYYFPDAFSSALFFSAIIMVITIVEFLLALYVVPVMVLEKKGLLPALAGSVALMKKTWREILGCVLVFGAAVLAIVAIAVLIGQSPLLLNHDYDFFLKLSRGQVLMTAVCYGFILACGVLAAVGSTVLGVAITGLYACGATDTTRPVTENTPSGVAEPSR